MPILVVFVILTLTKTNDISIIYIHQKNSYGTIGPIVNSEESKSNEEMFHRVLLLISATVVCFGSATVLESASMKSAKLMIML